MNSTSGARTQAASQIGSRAAGSRRTAHVAGHRCSRAHAGTIQGNAPTAMIGRFVEVDPPSRVTFTWGWELEPLAVPPQSTAVEVSLTREGDETLVRLTHRRLPPDSVDFHNAGWGHYLPRLVAAASGAEPGPDPWQAQASAAR